jgi:hypothetical protein
MIYNTMDTQSSQMNTINSTFFYDNDFENPTIIKKDFSTTIILDTIRESISSQHLYTFGVKPPENQLDVFVDGFVLFNLHKNKYMLNSKDELLKYMNNTDISLEEKTYFSDIFLYIQRPRFLTFDEHEYIRTCGNLNEYTEFLHDDYGNT